MIYFQLKQTQIVISKTNSAWEVHRPNIDHFVEEGEGALDAAGGEEHIAQTEIDNTNKHNGKMVRW